MSRIQFPQRDPPERQPKPARKGLRRVSKARSKLNRELGPQRKAFLESVGTCMVCRQRPAVECHEICAGAAREACLDEWMLVMAVCRACHNKIQGTPAAKQIKLRIRWTIEETCRRYCELKGLASTAVVAEEVILRLACGKKR